MVLQEYIAVKNEPLFRSSKSDELGYILQHCYDLPAIQVSKMVEIPNVLNQSLNETEGLELAKALRRELLFCAELITQRQRLPIDKIVSAIDKYKVNIDNEELSKLQREIGIPFSRNKLDVARYYAIRLVMQGVSRQDIAEFLDVDIRTVANYIAQAKKCIGIILETRAAKMQEYNSQTQDFVI
jgi:transposase